MPDSSSKFRSRPSATTRFILRWWRWGLRVCFKPDGRSVSWLRGQMGERAAARFLVQRGMRLLVRNYRSRRGEIDLVLREKDCLVFVEVKTRSDERWVRPAAAINQKKRRHLSMAALDYMRAIKNPACKTRFDVVEVLVDDDFVVEIRHLPNCFEMESPFRYF